MMAPLTTVWPFIITVSTLGTAIVTFSDVESPVRPLIAFWFLLICPGMAIVPFLGIREGISQLTLATALSLALDGLVSVSLLYAGLWSPDIMLAVLIVISLTGAALQIFRLGRYQEQDRLAP